MRYLPGEEGELFLASHKRNWWEVTDSGTVLRRSSMVFIGMLTEFVGDLLELFTNVVEKERGK